ncbi:MAG: GTPase domain-containing protein [Propionibacteriaceae bacterium]|nr:GTPase domain-containing protein [Propionibacteriaceae bacterium]
MGEQRAQALTGLRDALAGVRLPLELPGSEAAATQAREAVAQLDDYVLPRLRRLEAPLLAVVGGSTGAGKSTLVNSVIGRVVSAPGVIRPTTRSPVLVHHPEDAAWFGADRILPGLARSADRVADARTLQLVPEPTLPPGLAILDAPDVDSVVAENRALAAQLLAAADLWLFVTSAARYADAVPWDYLRSAAARDAVVAVVLDRVPPAAMAEVPVHLGQMMGQRGLGSSPLFAVPETRVDADGLLPEAAVAPIRGWLAELAHDAASRRAVVLQTLDGAIRSLVAGSPRIAQAVTDQATAIQTLRTDAEQSYAEAVRTVSVQTADGSILRGEVLERWHDFVGTGEFFRAVEQRIGWLRDRMVAAFKGEPKQALEVTAAVESGMEVLIREAGEAAADRTASAWQAHPAGRDLLGRAVELTRASQDFDAAAKQVVRDWQSDVMELVSEVGASKKSRARFWALGVNGVGVALMILVFSQTGGLVGAELGVAGGTAVLAQRVLEAVFGEDAVRRLAKQAKQQLDDRVEVLLAGELARYESALAAVDVRPEQAEAITTAVRGVEVAGPAQAEGALEPGPRPALPEASPGPTAIEASGEPVLEGTVIIAEEQP